MTPLASRYLSVCSYVEKYDLQEPSDDIQHVLKRIAVKLKKTQRVKAITGVGKKDDATFFMTVPSLCFS